MTSITQTPAYRVAFSMYVALGGDKTRIFDSVEAIYAEIDKFYGKGSRITTEALTLEITENKAELYNDDAITGYKPVSISVNVPQKYTDERVEELKETSRQQGYDSGYNKGIADGYVQGESEGYTDGYVEGLEDGAEDQKSLLEDITIRDNGVYEKEDGYKKVTVEVPIPTFETEELSVEITDNGTYNYTPTTDGYSKVNINIEVSGAGAEAGSLYDFASRMNVSESESAQLNNMINVDVNYTKSLLDSYIKPDPNNYSQFSNFRKGLYKGNTRLVYGPKIDISGITTLGSNTNSTSSSTEGGLFQNCKYLIWVPALNTSSVIHFGETFSGCIALKRIEPMDFSKCTNISRMCYECVNLENLPFTEPLYNLTSVYNAFFACKKLKSIPYIDTSKITTIGPLFMHACEELESPVELDLSSCTDFTSKNTSNGSTTNGTSHYSSMFGGCKKLKSVKLLNINPACAYILYRIFNDCHSLTDVEITGLEGWSPKDMSSTFNKCKSLETAPMIDTSANTTFASTFYQCEKLVNVPLYDTSNVTSFNYTFQYCYNLTTIPAFNTSNVTNFSYCFDNCSKLASLPELDCGKVSSGSNMNIFGSTSLSTLTDLGGFKDLGKVSGFSKPSYFLKNIRNLTKESMLNVINKLYDRASAGYSVVQLPFNSVALALLSDEEKAIATNKGWTLTTS